MCIFTPDARMQADLRQEVSLDYTALYSEALFLDKDDNSELSADRVYSTEKSLSIF